jgi:hypothetical protein
VAKKLGVECGSAAGRWHGMQVAMASIPATEGRKESCAVCVGVKAVSWEGQGNVSRTWSTPRFENCPQSFFSSSPFFRPNE